MKYAPLPIGKPVSCFDLLMLSKQLPYVFRRALSQKARAGGAGWATLSNNGEACMQFINLQAAEKYNIQRLGCLFLEREDEQRHKGRQ